jgi:hypothetical protein
MPPGISRRIRQAQNPEQIEPAFDPRRRAAQRKDKGPDQVEHQQERIHPGLSHLKPSGPPLCNPRPARSAALWRQPSARRDDQGLDAGLQGRTDNRR